MCKVVNIKDFREKLNIIDNCEIDSKIKELEEENKNLEAEIKKLKSSIAINKGVIKDLENAKNQDGPLGIA